MPRSSSSRPTPSTTTERESALSLTLRALLWAAVIAFVLVAVSPMDMHTLSWRQLAWWREEAASKPWLTPTAHPTARVGIISGHWKYDSGATCPDGLKEADVNYAIALRVQAALRKAGYHVDLLAEGDSRLKGYQAAALVSIHADVCDLNPNYTGFKTAAASDIEKTAQLRESRHLKRCLDARYAAATGLPYHPASISRHMSEYYVFDLVASTTPSVIIETGFLGMDRDLLTNHPDVVAQGITAGILCYLHNEIVATPTPTNP